MINYNELIGNKYGNLTLISLSGLKYSGKKRTMFGIFKCDCGNKKELKVTQVRNGITISCGCYVFRNIWKTEIVPMKRIYTSSYNSAKRRGHNWNISHEFAYKLYGEKCYYCGCIGGNIMVKKGKEFYYNGIDRLNNDIGYIESNCVACCGKCNYMKGSMNELEFKDKIIEIYKNIK